MIHPQERFQYLLWLVRSRKVKNTIYSSKRSVAGRIYQADEAESG